MGPMTIRGPLLPPALRDAITRQDDRLPPELLLKASRREVGGLPYATIAAATGALVAVVLLVALLIIDLFF